MVGWQNCTFWQSLGCSVGSCGFANVCNVGGGSFFFFCGGGRKKQNKFPSNLHCPVKKLNHFLFQIVTIVSVCSSVALTLVANGWVYANVGDCGLQTYQTVMMLKRATALYFSTIPPILYIPCCMLALLLSLFIYNFFTLF